MRNEQASQDVRNARTGKDAVVYNGDGTLLARIENFQAQANFNNVQYTPLGCTIEMEAPNTVGITISFNEIVIEDEEFFTDMMSYMGTGKLPEWSMRGDLYGTGEDGEEPVEQVTYNNCVPSGSIDIQNFSVGDTIKRAWSMHCNSVPKLTKELSYSATKQ